MEVIDCEQEINYDWPSIIAQKNIYANFNFFKGWKKVRNNKKIKIENKKY